MMGKQAESRRRFREACERLADLIEYGHLMAQTDPATFIESAADEIIRLRKLNQEVVDTFRSRRVDHSGRACSACGRYTVCGSCGRCGCGRSSP